MVQVIEIASKISSPLGLGGLVATLLFYLCHLILSKNTVPGISKAETAKIIKNIVDKLFILALVATCLGIVGNVMVAVASASPAFTHLPPPSATDSTLSITRLELLDESSYTKQAASDNGYITQLDPRSNNDFRYTLPADLHVAIVFLCEGYAVKGNLETHLDPTFSIFNSKGKQIALVNAAPFTCVSEWRSRPDVQHVGSDSLIKFFGLPSVDSATSPIPFLVILHAFKPNEIPDGDGRIKITIKDELSSQVCADEVPIHVEKR